MDPRRPWIRRKDPHSALPRKIQHRALDVNSPRGRCLGHTGESPGSVAAAYHFPDLEPPLSIAAFADVDDPAVVDSASGS
jgi:hypothetical protein